MTLQEIFEQLGHSELAMLNLGGDGAGINESNWERVLSTVNRGLTELHKRFPLREGRVLLQMQPGQRAYLLDPKHALTTPAQAGVTKYLKDSSDEPFTGDLLKVERVLTAVGEDLLLNGSGDSWDQAQRSVRTPSYNRLILPSELPVQELQVVFRADHPRLVKTPGYFNLADVEVDLPRTHAEALIYFVASRLFSPIGLSGNTAYHEGNNYLQLFESACALLENQDYQYEEREENYRLYRNGWV